MSYDTWKTREPDYGDEPEKPFDCWTCCDSGWWVDENDRTVPCPECSGPITLNDLDRMAGDIP